jgi:hypothetical protein
MVRVSDVESSLYVFATEDDAEDGKSACLVSSFRVFGSTKNLRIEQHLRRCGDR